jgi:hypothetical protein
VQAEKGMLHVVTEIPQLRCHFIREHFLQAQAEEVRCIAVELTWLLSTS